MKKITIGVAVASTLVAAILLNGCGQGGGTTTGGPVNSPPASSSGITSAEKNSFKEVTAHLDPGGNLYLYLSTEQWLDNLSGKFSDWRSVFQSLPIPDADTRQNVMHAFDFGTSLIKHSGIEQISGVGISSIEREKGLYRTTSILHHYPGNNSGYIWSAFGKKPHSLDGLDLLPDDTAAAFVSDLDMSLIWSAVQQEADSSGIPEITSGVQNVPQEFASATGLKLQDVLDSLAGEYGLVITLDDSHMVTLPIPGQSMQIPEPAIMAVFKVKNDLIFDAVDARLKGNSRLISRETNGIRMRTMLVPVPVPISFRPTIARSGDYLFVASTDAIIDAAMAVNSGKKPGLKSTDEFKHLAQGIPDQGNSFSFVSKKFGQIIQDLQARNLQTASARGSSLPPATMQKLMGLSGGPAGAYAVSANGDDGWLSIGNGNQDPSKVALLVPVAAAGLLAGIAVPNFVRARATAQHNACINNLRLIDAAKQQWAIENNKPQTAVPTWSDLRPFFGRGRNGAIPVCPEGGTYSINAVNQPPTCSIPGHALPQ